jgi:hypothetical protein
MERMSTEKKLHARDMTQRGVRLGIAALLAAGLASSCRDKPRTFAGPYGKQVSDAIPKIELAVGLKFKRAPKVETRSKEQVRQFVTSQVTDPQAAKDLDGKTVAYKRLGMIPDSLDMKKFMINLLAEQIIGYYDPHTKVL